MIYPVLLNRDTFEGGFVYYEDVVLKPLTVDKYREMIERDGQNASARE